MTVASPCVRPLRRLAHPSLEPLSMTYSTLKTWLDQGVMTLTLSRPEQLNRFTVTMADELEDF